MKKSIQNLLAYAFLIGSILLAFAMVSCKTSKQSIKQELDYKRDSLSQISNLKSKTIDSVYVVVSPGFTEEFEMQALDGRIPEFEKKIKSGNFTGVVGFSKDKGVYYNFVSDTTITSNKVKVKDSVAITNKGTFKNTRTKQFEKEVKTVSRWGNFQWITFLISLLALLFLVYRIYKLLPSGPSLAGKIFKKIFSSL